MKYILIIFFWVANLSCAFSQDDDPHYGEDLLNWVKTDANAKSLAIMNSDFQLRCMNHFIAKQEFSFKIINIGASRLEEINKTIKTQESELSGLEPVVAALKRSQYATEINNRIIVILDSLLQVKKLLLGGDSASSREYFINNGLYHVGSTNVIESFFSLGNHLKSTFRDVYGVSLSITYGDNGKVEYDYQMVPKNLNQYEQAGETVILAIGSYGGPYGFAAAVVVDLVYNIFKGESLKSKIDKQNKLVDEAFALLPKVLLSTEDSYKLYLEKFNVEQEKFDTLSKRMSNGLDSLINNYKNTIAINIARVKLNETVLTSAKVDELDKYFMGNRITPSDALALKNLAEYLPKLSLSATTDRMKLIRSRTYSSYDALENYQDEIIENYYILKNVRSQRIYMPLWNLLDEEIAEYKNAVNELPSLYSALLKNDNQKINAPKNKLTFTNSTKLKKISSATISYLTKQNTSKQLAISHTLSVQTEIKSNETPNCCYQPILVVDGHIYNVGYVDPNSYSASQPTIYSNTGNYSSSNPSPPTQAGTSTVTYNSFFLQNRFGSGILNSSYDGGYKSDIKRQAGEVNGFKKNVDDRINQMKSEYEGVNMKVSEWKGANNIAIGTLQSKQLEVASSIKADYNKFLSANSSVLATYSNQLNAFLNTDISTGSLNSIFERSGINKRIIDEIPHYYIRPQSSVELPINSFREGYYGVVQLNKRIIQYELEKESNDFKTVEIRVKNNVANGIIDPVFSSIDEFYMFVNVANNNLSYAQECLNPNSYVYKQNPSLAKSLCNEYIQNAKAIRYYSDNYIMANDKALNFIKIKVQQTINLKGLSTIFNLGKLMLQTAGALPELSLGTKIICNTLFGSIFTGGVGVLVPTELAKKEIDELRSIPDLEAYMRKFGKDINKLYLEIDKQMKDNSSSLCDDRVYKLMYKCN